MGHPIKIGIVGTGGMAAEHARQFKQMPQVMLASCFDLLPERARAFAQVHGFEHVAENLDQLIGRVDAVSVVTPDRFHAKTSLAVLHAGKHLLCEKPLTVTLAEAREVAGAAQQAARRGVIHMVDFSYRSSAAMQRAIEMVASGQLGEVRHVHSHYLQGWLASNKSGNWTNEALLWRLQTAAGSGGALGDLGCHILDLTTAVAGDVQRVRCELRTFAKIAPDGSTVIEWQGKKLDANDTALIEVEFANGAIGIVQATRWATGYSNALRLEVHGTRGALNFDLARDERQLNLCIDEERHKAKWTTETLTAAPTIWERFIHAIERGKPDQPDVLRGAHVQAYLDACERSAASGKWENVSAWI